MNKDEAIYQAYCEIVPYTNKSVQVQVEEGEDEFGVFIRVHWDDKISSKIRYKN